MNKDTNIINNVVPKKDENKCKYCDFPITKGDNHEFYCGSKQTECEYCSMKLLSKDYKKHLENCLNKIAIDNMQFEEEILNPKQSNYNNDLVKKESIFREDDIRINNYF